MLVNQKTIGLGLVLQCPVWFLLNEELGFIILITGLIVLIAPQNKI